MPSHIPKTDTTKKQIQLSHRELQLEHVLKSGLAREKLARVAEKLRAARLSLLKAELYWANDARLDGRDMTARLANIQDETRKWTEKSADAILNDFKT